MAESEWPGDELPPRERAVVAALVLKGWQYMYRDEDHLILRSPDQLGGNEWWQVKADGGAPPERITKQRPEPVRTVADRLAAVRRQTPKTNVDLHCKARKPGYTLRQVRALMKQGYSADKVVEITGWGGYWIADLIGMDGYYHESDEAHRPRARGSAVCEEMGIA